VEFPHTCRVAVPSYTAELRAALEAHRIWVFLADVEEREVVLEVGALTREEAAAKIHAALGQVEIVTGPFDMLEYYADCESVTDYF